MILDYVRNIDGLCECLGIPDIEKVPENERPYLAEWWNDGYIYRNGVAKPCSCYRMHKTKAKYNLIARTHGLPFYDEITTHKYFGTNSVDMYNKIMKLPNLLIKGDKGEVKVPSGFTIYLSGGPDTQKTTTAAKIILKTLSIGQTPAYYTMGKIFADLANEDTALAIENQFKYADLLIIDDAFMGKPCSYYSIFDSFATLLQERTKPTMFITQFSADELVKTLCNDNFYKAHVLHSIVSKAKQTDSVFEFKDDVVKHKAAESMTVDGEINIWS